VLRVCVWCCLVGCVVHGAWCMVRGAWCMVHGAWCMVHGAWCCVPCAKLVGVVRGGAYLCEVVVACVCIKVCLLFFYLSLHASFFFSRFSSVFLTFQFLYPPSLPHALVEVCTLHFLLLILSTIFFHHINLCNVKEGT
jgi:hypothetical protein